MLSNLVLPRTRREKNMTEKVDVAGVLAYKTDLEVMDVRCSNSVAALAVLMGGGVCALFAPTAWAGDRIEFSAPAIPLNVPRPEVEVKEPARMIGSANFAGSVIGNTVMASPSSYVLIRPKHKDNNDWSLDPRLDNDPSQRDNDDLFTGRQDSTRETNSNNFNAKQGMNPGAPGGMLQQRNDSALDGSDYDSRFGASNGLDRENSRFAAWSGADKDNPRFGSRNGAEREQSRFDARNGLDGERSKNGKQNGLEKDYARSSDLLNRGNSSANDDSFLTKVFGHEAPGMSRFDPTHPSASMSDPRTFSGGVFGDRMNEPGFAQDSARVPASAPGYTSFNPLDDSQSRQQFGEPGGEGQASFRAWEEPAASANLPTRNFSSPDQANSRVVAPTRGAILSMPSRPGDPH